MNVNFLESGARGSPEPRSAFYHSCAIGVRVSMYSPLSARDSLLTTRLHRSNFSTGAAGLMQKLWCDLIAFSGLLVPLVGTASNVQSNGAHPIYARSELRCRFQHDWA